MKESELNARYRYRNKGKRLTIDFYPTELDLAEWVESHQPKQTYIKNLIREDLQKQKNGQG